MRAFIISVNKNQRNTYSRLSRCPSISHAAASGIQKIGVPGDCETAPILPYYKRKDERYGNSHQHYLPAEYAQDPYQPFLLRGGDTLWKPYSTRLRTGSKVFWPAQSCPTSPACSIR